MNGWFDFPKSVFLIIATEFCERFSFCGLRTILSLYLRNVLLLDENAATVLYHVFITVCYLVPLFGAILADSYLGRYRTILYFSILYSVGNVFMCIATTLPSKSACVTWTVLGLLLIAVGTGGIKPCVAAFGGDQFHLPEQEFQLQQFFSVFYFAINFGGLMGMIVSPLLRRVKCFGGDTCYALGFGFPTALMVTSLFLFVCGKPSYRIISPKENIILQFMECTFYAYSRKLKSRKSGETPEHWLDYASGAYSSKLIHDMKIVLTILWLNVPLPLFWSLFDQQGSRWTFQASHMDGTFLGTELLPDQMQIINPVIVLILIPLFDKFLYSVMERYGIFATPLQRMLAGGILAGMAFLVAAILEFKLQEFYPVLPEKDKSSINLINILPCTIHVRNIFNRDQVVNATKNFIFNNIAAKGTRNVKAIVSTRYKCGDMLFLVPKLQFDFMISELQVETVIVTSRNYLLKAYKSTPEELQKSLLGKSRIRVIFLKETVENLNISLTLRSKSGFGTTYYVPEKYLSASAYMEVVPARYVYEVLSFSSSITNYTASEYLQPGAVYTLVLQEKSFAIVFSKLYVTTPPNRVHMFWLIPQYILISMAEVMFAITGLQFSFTQAPKSMKTIAVAAWYLSVAFGNILVIIVTQSRMFRNQAYEFLLFAVLIIIDMVLFGIMIAGYNYVPLEIDGSSTMFLSETLPLLGSGSDS